MVHNLQFLGWLGVYAHDEGCDHYQGGSRGLMAAKELSAAGLNLEGGKEQKLQIEYQKTLYLTGEVFHTEMSGTVEGALSSGKEAAKKILTKLSVSV